MIKILYLFLMLLFCACSSEHDNYIKNNENYIYPYDSKTFFNSVNKKSNLSDIDFMTDKFQKYISSMGDVSGSFVQKSSNGDKQIGEFYISIPGKMRINYKNGIVVLADGHDFIYYDSSNDQITVLSLESSPAGILLSKTSLDNIGAKITKIKRDSGITYLYVVIKNNLFNTQVIFKVMENPFKLLGWIVQDLQGVTTDFSIVELKSVKDGFDKKLFILKRNKSYGPSGTKIVDDYY